MKTTTRLLLIVLATFALTACKIDLSVIGLGKVDTVSGSFHCDITTGATRAGCVDITNCTVLPATAYWKPSLPPMTTARYSTAGKFKQLIQTAYT